MRSGHFQFQNLFGTLPVLIIRLISPRVVESGGAFVQTGAHIRFSGTMGISRGGVEIDLVVAGGTVVAPTVADAGVDETIRLVFFHEMVKLVGLRRGDRTGGIEDVYKRQPLW